MRLFFRIFLCAFVLVLPAAALSQEPPPRAYTIPNSVVIPIRSKTNGVDYELYVKLPAGYATSTDQYPLLVTLDADYQFAIASNHVEHLAGRGQSPDMVIVSIGYAYDPEDKDAYKLNRTRDYTPVHTETGGYGPAFQKVSGGGPAFAEFIRSEVIPLLEARYRLDSDERVYIGHSYGGLFGAYLLLSEPDIFNRYILVSPSLWYNDQMMIAAAKKAKPFARKTYLYMGIGSWENHPDGEWHMIDEMNDFAAALAAHDDPNLVMKSRVFDDETHASIYPVVLSAGIRQLFLVMDQAAD